MVSDCTENMFGGIYIKNALIQMTPYQEFILFHMPPLPKMLTGTRARPDWTSVPRNRANPILRAAPSPPGLPLRTTLKHTRHIDISCACTLCYNTHRNIPFNRNVECDWRNLHNALRSVPYWIPDFHHSPTRASSTNQGSDPELRQELS